MISLLLLSCCMQHLPMHQPEPLLLPQQLSPTRRPAKKPFKVTASHDAVLQGVYKLQIATSEQLRVLLWYSKNSLERVQKLVKQLADNGYLLYDCVPTKKAKSPYYYFLARRGRQYCDALGRDVREYFRPSQEKELGSPFIHHTLSLNDVLISAIHIEHHAPDYSLFDFTHERVLKQTPYKASVTRPDGTQGSVTLIPDAFLLFVHTKENGKEKTIAVLYEHDMGTCEQRNYRKKISAYIKLIKSGAYKELLGVKEVIVAYGTPAGDKRRDQMRDWTRKEMASTNEPKWITQLFFFTALPTQLHPLDVWRKPVWYLPFDDTKPRILLV